jgi:hypothetical protein
VIIGRLNTNTYNHRMKSVCFCQFTGWNCHSAWILNHFCDCRSLRLSVRSSPLAAPVHYELAFETLNWALLAQCSANLSRRMQWRNFWFHLEFLFIKIKIAHESVLM